MYVRHRFIRKTAYGMIGQRIHGTMIIVSWNLVCIKKVSYYDI